MQLKRVIIFKNVNYVAKLGQVNQQAPKERDEDVIYTSF